MMQQLAAIVGDGSPAQPVVDGTASTTATPGKTAAASGDGDTKTDTDTATKGDIAADATDAPSGAVTDALSLLNVAAPMAAQVQAQAQATPGILAGAGLAVTSSGKSQASAGTGSTSPVASPRGKTSAVAADALDTSAAAADSDETTTFMPTGLAALKASAAGGSKSGTAAATDDSSTTTFRIARADSKVQALDMAISKNADDTTQADVQAASGTGTETVTVLDSRRYLGLADGSNSALVANTLSGNKDWSSAMKAGSTAATTAVASNTSKVVNTLKIQMNPEKLGTVTATMRLSGETLSVDLKVQSAEAYRQLSNDQGPMVDSLRAQGYKVDNITVTYAPQATTDSGQQQNSQAGFQGQQQSGASQGQGGEAQSRRQNSGQRTGDQDGNWGTQNVGSDDSVAGNAQRTRSSGVYL
jgi:chemotaxis protein MotD